jgi:ATP-dependent DNA helicase RecG
METSAEQFERWLAQPKEDEHLEFKQARNQYDTQKLAKYCVALANEGGGKLVLGVTDVPPRSVVGTSAFTNVADIQRKLFEKLKFRVDVEEFVHAKGRVVIFHVPPRPFGTAYAFEGAYLMRSTEDLVPMTEDRLRQIFGEGRPDWLFESAKIGLSEDEVLGLLDAAAYFELMKMPYPGSGAAVLERLKSEELISATGAGWNISNLAAILLAKKLSEFSLDIARKGPRVVIYEGTNKLATKIDYQGTRGYAVGFKGLVEYVHKIAPQNKFVEEVLREEVKMFPRQALRELIANALIHQDFSVRGGSVMIEMYSDRVEISNPGIPPIQVDRFIDEYRSRNERLADLMRRMGACEEKGSGVDKVVHAAEAYQLPAPDFRVSEARTTAILFAHQDFADMSRADRTRACYQHCCLKYVSNARMSNQSLRERFRLSEAKTATASQVISATKEANLIKPDETDSASTRYARYVPYWA